MLHPPDLESRQSILSNVLIEAEDAPPAGFGIKAKHSRWRLRGRGRCSTRRTAHVPSRHTLKLSPQEQLALALGLENLNPPAMSLDE